jgi:3'-phosphoadenosine 5'-phosphosulfate sulfotransferase (PAPS reductase)/FAD synthetase
MSPKLEPWQLKQFQGLPLEVKIEKSKLRIREWYEHWEGQVYVSFSGDVDSTVLLDLVRQEYPDTPAMFLNTGVEFPEIVKFVKSVPNVEMLRPAMPFKQVLREKGYPVVSKRISQYIYELRHYNLSPERRAKLLGQTGSDFSISKKWQYLLEAPFEIGDGCCSVLKKRPAKKYEKTTGRKVFLGMLASDSMIRLRETLKHGCNYYSSKRPSSNPLSFWTKSDIISYLVQTKIPYCNAIYGDIIDNQFTGYGSTGCVFCAFGIANEKPPNRYQRLKLTHPKLHAYALNDLGWANVLDYMGIPYE